MAFIGMLELSATIQVWDEKLGAKQKQDAAAALVFTGIIEIILLCAFTYRLWKRIQDGQTQVTPGRAVGYLFIPIYGLFWMWKVWAGYADALNSFRERHGFPERASGKITTTFTVIWLVSILLSWTPAGPLGAMAVWISLMVFIAHTGKLTSDLA
ncbi:hypothetical protein MYX77_04810 [Acidobacteriia bacterium AH_259_A11_L15]|nr:hypothetical protein [Acidobacteriia bacterium AH_259_A11_L15]